MFMAGLERGKTNRSQTATDMVMVIKQSPGSWSHLWSLSNVNVCGSTSLFGSCAGTHQGKGISLALWKIEMIVTTPKRFTHLIPLFTSFTTVRIWM